jgi:predicted ABC-type sugar transport system permease subunit
MPRVRVLGHVARIVVDYFTLRRLVVDYFDYAVCLVASARRAASHAARRRLLGLRRASGCLGSSRGSLSTTSTTPRVRLLRHVARLVAPLVVDNFASRRLVVDYFASRRLVVD